MSSGPAMVEALRRCHDRLRTALVTNNFVTAGERSAEVAAVFGHFDVIVESSKSGLRKPDPAIYQLVCRQLEVEPSEVVFLDDLGVNLKPARQLGMTTIKVTDPDAALRRTRGRGRLPLGVERNRPITLRGQRPVRSSPPARVGAGPSFPSAGDPDGARATWRSRKSSRRSRCSRECTNVHPPMFSGSSCTHMTSVACS